MKCTPQYNQATRELMRKRDDLNRVAKAAETGNFHPVIRAKSNEFIDAGHSAEEVLAKTHEYVNQYAPHTKEEVAAGITTAVKRAPSKSEATKQRAAIKAELRDLYSLNSDKPAATPEERANKTRQTILKKRLAEIDRRFAENDFAKPGKREGGPAYSDDTLALQRQLNVAQRRVDGLIARQEARNQSIPWKIGNFAHNVHLGFILTSVAVYPKLLAAVLSHWVTSPAKDLIVSAARTIPGVRKWADLAPRHGQGFVLGAQGAMAAGIGKGLKGSAQQLLRGSSDLEDLYGSSANASNEFTDFVGEIGDAMVTHDYLHVAKVVTSIPGRTHAAIKELASQPEFYKSFFLYDKAMRERLAKEGHDQPEIDAFMARESTKAMLGAKAYAMSLEAKFQGKNRFADSVNLFIGRMDKGSPAEQALGFALKTIFPIRKIPMNIVKGVTSYTFGGVKALTRMRGDFTEENAEYIMKNIAQQGVGLTLLAIGYVGGTGMFGGIPQAGDKKRNPDVKPDEAKLGSLDIGKGAFHGDAAQMLQLGAGLRRLYEKDYGESGSAVHAGLTSFSDNYSSLLIRGIPYTDTARRWSDTARYGRGAGEIAGNTVRSMVVPQVVQQFAAKEDPFPGYRKPQDIVDDVKLGIPGAREEVGFGDPKKLSLQDRIDAYGVMTPAERASNDMLKHIRDAARHDRKKMTPDQREKVRTILDSQP